MNLKRIIIIFLTALVLQIADAQEIKVKSFSIQIEPMTVPMQRKDNNGNVCALVKVIIPSAQAAFEGSLVGSCEFKTSEYWCYLSPGSKYLKVKYPGCEPLLVNFAELIGTGVISKQIYELLLEVPNTFHEQNQKIYTISIVAHSNEITTLLGKQMYAHMDSVIVKRYNSQGLHLDSHIYNQGVLAAMSGEYNFQVGAVKGDKFEVSAKGYQNSVIDFNDTKITSYHVTLCPIRLNVKFWLKDSKNKNSLIGGNVFKNPKKDESFFSIHWDNWSDTNSRDIKSDEYKVTNADGLTDVFSSVRSTDEFLFTYLGYKDKKVSLLHGTNGDNSLGYYTYVVELEPYEYNDKREIFINIGGMGIDDKGDVTVTNTRSKESFTMSQKTTENHKRTIVTIGDEIVLTRRGFRTISVKFRHSIPERLNIAPQKGKKSNIQFLEF